MKWKSLCYLLPLLLVSFTLSGMIVREAVGMSAQVSLREESFPQIIVAPGDTLWSIAREYGGQGKDPRPLIHEIARLNRLDTATIHPGQVLLLPLPK